MTKERDAKKDEVAGTHYLELGIQPWEIIEKNGLDFFEGNLLKYLLRYKSKGGLEDLKKCQHYLIYIMQREESNP